MRRVLHCDDPARLTRQLPLSFQERPRRGGARPGAGRPRKKPSVVPHRLRGSHRKGDPVHVTLRVGARVPSLRSQVLAGIVARCLRAQREKLKREKKEHFQLVHFSIQADHLHLIVEATDKCGLPRGVMGLEIRVAKRI